MVNLIGISGKIGSGKDEVTNIIQKYSSINFENKKFAETLKQFTANLIGCRREQLEEQDFKASLLGPEWDIIEKAIVGYEHASPIKESVSRQMTIRELLIRIGDGARNVVHPDIWVNGLFSDYKPLPKQPYLKLDNLQSQSFLDLYRQTACEECQSNFIGYKRQSKCAKCIEDEVEILPNWIVSDMRYTNEAIRINKEGGVCIRINRPNIKTIDHPSETQLDDYNNFTYIINNDGTLEDLRSKVLIILEELGVKK